MADLFSLPNENIGLYRHCQQPAWLAHISMANGQNEWGKQWARVHWPSNRLEFIQPRGVWLWNGGCPLQHNTHVLDYKTAVSTEFFYFSTTTSHSIPKSICSPSAVLQWPGAGQGQSATCLPSASAHMNGCDIRNCRQLLPDQQSAE